MSILRHVAVVFSLLAAACAGDATSSEPPAPPDHTLTSDASNPVPATKELVVIEPDATGDTFTPGFGPHLVGAPDGEPSGELLVFFAGTGGDPTFYETFLGHALDLGDHVIGLAYPNAESVNFDLCVDTDDPTCAERARSEVLFGSDAGPLDAPLDVDPDDSVLARLEALLEHLVETRPDEGWDAFIDGDAPAWSSIATAGHSQGGGHAAFLGLDEELARVILFDATEPAPWTDETFATPPERMWAIAHVDETIFAGISRSWTQLEIPDSQQVVVAMQDCSGDPASFGFFHNCPVVDDFLPDPVPTLLTDAWTRVLTA